MFLEGNLILVNALTCPSLKSKLRGGFAIFSYFGQHWHQPYITHNRWKERSAS